MASPSSPLYNRWSAAWKRPFGLQDQTLSVSSQHAIQVPSALHPT